MNETQKPDLDTARQQARRAAQWLTVIRFQAHPGAPVFRPGISTYAHMVDPTAADDVRLQACRGILPAVEFQAQQEHWRHKGQQAPARDRDPHGAEWETTERGAVLELVAEFLRNAIEAFESTGAGEG